MPLATIIIPYLNQCTHAQNALCELCQISGSDTQYILVKPAGLETPSNLPTEVILIESPVRSNAEAVNAAVDTAKGDYVGFYNPKDRWSPKKSFVHIAALEDNPDVGMSFSGLNILIPDQTSAQWQHNPRLMNITAAYILKQNPIFAFSNIFARKEALEASCLTDEKTGSQQWCDPLAPNLISIDIALRIMTRTDWLIEGVPKSLCLINLSSDDLGAPNRDRIIEWKRLMKARAPMAPAFFARHAGAARKEFLKGNSACLQPIMTHTSPEDQTKFDVIERNFSKAIRSDFKNRAHKSKSQQQDPDKKTTV